MKKIAFLFSVICLLCINAVSAQINNIYISEILYDSPLQEYKPLPIHNNGEYIKLTNPTNTEINVSSWVIKGDEDYEQYIFPEETIIPAHGILLMAYKSGTDFDFASYYHLEANIKIINQSSIILCNWGEYLSLFDASSNLVDAVAYGDRSTSSYNSGVYASNSDISTYNQLLSLHRTQVSYANAKVFPLSITDLTYGLATPSASENALVNNTTPDIPIIPPLIDVSPLAGQNYIITSVPKVAKASSVLGATDELTTFQYFDGLGRPVETVQVGITPKKADFVSYAEYDGVGRESIKWLPTPIDNNKGAFVDFTDFKSKAISSHASDNRAYIEIKYEPSPLNRITEEIGAGVAWEKHSKTIDYQTNDGSIAYFYVNNSKQLCKGLNYDAGTLYVTQSIDEDKNERYEFKDKLDQVVLKRSISNSENIDTYYAYNDLGQLCCVIPPEASPKLVTNVSDQTTMDQFCYLYQYDERGNCTRKKLPGCDPIYMVYDKADRLVLSQDGNQRPQNKWVVTKYDIMGRVLYTGLIEISTSHTDLISNLSETIFTESLSSSNNFMNTGYTCSNYTPESLLTVNYFDKYNDFIQNQPEAIRQKLTYSDLDGYDKAYMSSLPTGDLGSFCAKGLLIGTRTYLLDGSDNYTVSAIYYDYKGQVVQARSTNHLGGYDIAYNAYYFTGKINKTLKEHSTSSTINTPVKEEYVYTYDHALRPQTTTYSLNNATSVILSDMSADESYDELGRLKQKERHDGADIESYDYNIRNWATKITSGTFTEELFYNTTDYNIVEPCFNGNISASTWTYNGIKKAYSYTYNNLNQLILANAYQISGNTLYAPNNKEEFKYDKQGNIQLLWRQKDYTLTDFLQLHYKGNQLDYVNDGQVSLDLYNVKEYKNESTGTSNEFEYDANGNMKKDLDRDIVTIQYNILNLPDIIQFKNGNQIINKYDAGGRKLTTDYFTMLPDVNAPVINEGEVCNWKSNWDMATQTGVVFVDNFEYKTEQLEGDPLSIKLDKVYNQEGYAEILSSTNKYSYYRKDHLGNNREVWCPAYTTKSGMNLNHHPAATTQRTQYYPSGLPWAEGMGQDTQNRKYNSKEFVEMHGYDTYDYGARGYYAAIGMFTSVDPLCEKYYSASPYSYCGGNSVNAVDPNGMDIYMLNSKGQYILALKTEDNHDNLYALDKSGHLAKTKDGGLKRETVNDKTIMPSLKWKEGNKSNSAVTSNATDAFNVFKFSADNSDNEWSLSGFKDHGKTNFYLYTGYDNGEALTGVYDVFQAKDMLFNIHSHTSEYGAKGGSGYDIQPELKNGKWEFVLKGLEKGYDGSFSNGLYKQTGRVMPLYVYYPNSNELYKYTPWNPAAKTWNNIGTAVMLQRLINPK